MSNKRRRVGRMCRSAVKTGSGRISSGNNSRHKARNYCTEPQEIGDESTGTCVSVFCPVLQASKQTNNATGLPTARQDRCNTD